MRRLIKWGLIGIVGVAALQAVAEYGVKDKSASPSKAEKTVHLAVASLKEKPYWADVTTTEADGRHFSLVLHYKSFPPRGMIDADLDTKTVARAVLAELVKEGQRPARDSISIFVWAQQDGLRGETGKPLVRVFGDARYNYNTDQISFEPQK